jgi:hypothetical protein
LVFDRISRFACWYLAVILMSYIGLNFFLLVVVKKWPLPFLDGIAI